MHEDIKFLVFDVESVPDPKLIKKVRYPDEDLSEQEAVNRFKEELLETSGGNSDFVPVTYHYPVSITIAKVKKDFTISKITCLDDPDFRTVEMVKQFWQGVEHVYGNAALVTFNGRGFDVPLLELMAYRYGINASRHFKDKYAGRNRFSTKHFDIMDWMSNYNAMRMHGGLNLLAKVIGKPGKMGTTGDKVHDLFLEGKLREINNYCIHDVLDTYFLFLRTRVMIGELTIEREQEIVQETKQSLIDKQVEIPAYVEYLENWGDWIPWP